MTRGTYIAISLIVAVFGALAVVRIVGTSDDTSAAAGDSSAEDSATDTGSDTASGDGAEGAEDDGDQAADADADEQPEPPPFLDPKPGLVDIQGWINTDKTSLDDFAGSVTVVEFWTFGCFNCKNRIPHTQELYADYHDQGLEIIGVHTPEFEFERDPAAVAQATEDLGVVWPVALDPDKTNFRAWQGSRRFWPRVYVLDQNGDVRYDRIGEGDYDGLESVVDHLLRYGP